MSSSPLFNYQRTGTSTTVFERSLERSSDSKPSLGTQVSGSFHYSFLRSLSNARVDATTLFPLLPKILKTTSFTSASRLSRLSRVRFLSFLPSSLDPLLRSLPLSFPSDEYEARVRGPKSPGLIPLEHVTSVEAVDGQLYQLQPRSFVPRPDHFILPPTVFIETYPLFLSEGWNVTNIVRRVSLPRPSLFFRLSH